MPTTGDWQGQYITWPNDDVFPDDTTYPDNVWEVTGEEDVYSYDGWRWERVTDEAEVEEFIGITESLKQTIRSIPVTLDMVVGKADGTAVNATVVEQLFSRYVTAEAGEFVKLTAGQIAAGAIGADQIAAGAIDGAVITGATIRTAASGARVEMDPGGIVSYNTAGDTTFRVNAFTGAVYARGDFGVNAKWGVAYFGEAEDRQISNYGTTATHTTYAAAGLRLYPETNPVTGAWTSVPQKSRGGVYLSYRHMSLTEKNNGYKGYPYTSTGIYGIAISAPTRFAEVSPTLLVEEGGMRFTGQSTGANLTFVVAPQRFEAYSPTNAGGYRAVVEGGADACVWFSANESSVRQMELGLYATYWTMRNVDYNFYTEPGRSTGGAFWWLTGERYTSGRIKSLMKFGSSASTDQDMFALWRDNYGSSAYCKFFVKNSGLPSLQVGSNMIQLVVSSGAAGAHVSTTQFYCYRITKNFIMQVPGITENKRMLLQHAATESPANGIEYWYRREADENGELLLPLPEYVGRIASQHVDKCVFVSCSEGTAEAWLEEDVQNLVVRAKNAVPGATLNILVKLGRILDTEPEPGEVFTTRWVDNAYDVWTPMASDQEIKDGTQINQQEGPALPDGAFYLEEDIAVTPTEKDMAEDA